MNTTHSTTADNRQLEDRYHVESYKRYPLVIVRGRDVWIETEEGERYLDLYGGHAVSLLGHCHPRLVEAIRRQAGELLFYSNLVYSPVRGRACQKTIEAAPQGIERAFLVNSGAEANENALKLARRVSGKPGILAFEGGFHGRTAGALSATGLGKMRFAFPPNLPGHFFAPFGDSQSVAAIFAREEIGGVILEPIQSMGGIRQGSPDFYRDLRGLCDRHGALLIYDEIQTGFGRTGTFFYAGRHGVVPDMITVAKGMAGGLPMGALLANGRVCDDVKPGDLGTTFGGGPLACAALEATLEVIRSEGLMENVVRQRRALEDALSSARGVKGILGEGLLIGILLDRPAAPVQRALMDRRILCGTSADERVLRLLPPLTIQSEHIESFASALRACLDEEMP